MIFKEENAWVAQVLEHDMAAHGGTPYAALAAVQLVLQTRVDFDTRVPLSRLKPAPEAYFRAFERGKPLQIPAHLELVRVFSGTIQDGPTEPVPVRPSLRGDPQG